MYRNMLPYNIDRDNSHIQGHNNTSDRSRLNRLHRVSQSSLARYVRSATRRINKALRRTIDSRSMLPTMNWWD